MSRLTIVLARVETETEVVRERRTDLGEAPIMREVPRPVACVWLRSGTAADVEKASTFAATEGYIVYTYPTTERDPLGRAKAEVVG